jgi:predicted nucleic acid-binding protein
VLGSGEPLVTTDHVLAKAWLLLRHRIGRPAAISFWGAVRAGASEVEHVGPADLEVAWSLGAEFEDKDFSLVDLGPGGVHSAGTWSGNVPI